MRLACGVPSLSRNGAPSRVQLTVEANETGGGGAGFSAFVSATIDASAITVQNKVEPAIAKALYETLSINFQPRSLSIYGLAAYYYRGGPWEQIGRWAFRG